MERYLEALLEGERKQARTVIEQVLQKGIPAITVYSDIIWPIMEEIEILRRSERISPVQEHLASRINRTIVDQLQNKLPKRPAKFKKIVVCCSNSELQELGAQIMADLFESNGWEVKFIGGGLTNDDILEFVNLYAPDILLIYGTTPKQAPNIRHLIDTIRSVNAWPSLRIMLSGGVFNRAEGLWEEIGADLFAESALKAVHTLENENNLKQPVNQINRSSRKRRKTANNLSVELQQNISLASE